MASVYSASTTKHCGTNMITAILIILAVLAVFVYWAHHTIDAIDSAQDLLDEYKSTEYPWPFPPEDKP